MLPITSYVLVAITVVCAGICFSVAKKRSQYPTMGGLGRIFRSVCVALFVFGKTTGSARSRLALSCQLFQLNAA